MIYYQILIGTTLYLIESLPLQLIAFQSFYINIGSFFFWLKPISINIVFVAFKLPDYKYDVIHFCYHDLLQMILYFVFFRGKFFHLSHICKGFLHPILHPIAAILFGMLFGGHLRILLSYPAILHLVICNILVCSHSDACWSPVCYDILSLDMVIYGYDSHDFLG